MGEVYRARDTRLARDVAIKVLPDGFAADPDRLVRFQREAQVLASLNHPNIAAIYGLEESGGVRALVMELVEGRDLSELVADQRASAPALSIGDAIPVARQIAEALEAAHEQGIIHRDLKPANVKVTATGAVKVLDFGLAKALDASGGAAADPANSPTLTARATAMGMILGTAAYMAPEQARGKVVDRRADIWAFGAVLYEMLTGQRAFQGDDATEVLAKIIEREPDLSRLPAATPASLRRLVERCLVKDPKQRLRDIGEARLALDDAAREVVQGPAPADARALASASPAAPTPWRTLLPWTVAAGLAVALIVTTALPREPPRTDAGVTRLHITLPTDLELYAVAGHWLSLSPDGKMLALVGVRGGARQVFLRRLDQFEVSPVRGTESAVSCVFSPDGRQLLIGTSGAGLKRVRISDGLVETVAIASSDYFGAWLSDTAIVFANDGHLWVSGEAPGAAPTQLTEGQAGSNLTESQPTVVPGGNAVLFVASSPEAPEAARIDAVSLRDRKRTTVVERATGPLLTSTGDLLFTRDGVNLASAFDRQTLRTIGEAVPVLPDVRFIQNRGGGNVSATVAVSDSGMLIYAPAHAAGSEMVSVSRNGAERTLFKSDLPVGNPRLSPDGRQLLYEEIGVGLQLTDLERRTRTQLGGGLFASFPLFTRGGQSAVFRLLTTALFTQALDGNAKPVQIAGTGPNEYPSGFSPDGKDLIYTKILPATAGDIYAVPLAGGKPRVLLSTPAYEGGAQVSPDGRWIVYASNDQGSSEIFLQPYPALDRRLQVSSAGGIQPSWNPKGGEVFYRNGNAMMSVRMMATPGGPVLTAPVSLFSGPYVYGAGLTTPNFAVAADGESFILVKEQAGVTLNVELNWFDELRRLVPVR